MFSVFVLQAVLQSSGIQTVVRCASAFHTVAVTPSPASAPARPTAGVRCASTPASVPATDSATPSTATAPATKAGGRQPAQSLASVPRAVRQAPAATRQQASVSVTGGTGGRGAFSTVAATCRHATSGMVRVSARRAGGARAVTGNATVTSNTAAVTRTMGSACATRGTRVPSATGCVKTGRMAVGVK